jgi:antirestriction protein ArdC
MTVTTKDDLHQSITNQIIAAIEAGAGEYQMPWNPRLCGGAGITIPHNPVGHYGYRGINILSLWGSQQANAYATPQWATFRQWQVAGAQVRKGEKGSLTIFFKTTNAGTGVENSTDQHARRHFIAKAAYVFNVAQVDGFEPPLPPQPLTPIERHIAADRLINFSAANIHHDSHHACYIPSRDEIHLPPEGAFFDAQSYYGVALHELVHWTGHPSRCARDLHNRFGSEAYAAEELIAELGSAFLCAEIGISPEPRIDHARYIDSWLKVLKSDKRAIFTAAAKANQAVTYLNALAEPAEKHDPGSHSSNDRFPDDKVIQNP